MSHLFLNTALYPDPKLPTIFLPGWGFDGRILQLINPSPTWIYPDIPLDPDTIEQDLLHLLTSNNIRNVRLVGWSMGAMLALKFAVNHLNLLDSLVLVSLRDHWPANEIKEIRTEFSEDPESFLKGFYRKCFLGDKQAYRSFSATLEPLYLADIKNNIKRLQHGLDFLETFRNPSPPPRIPIRLIHGRQDLVAPVKDMPIIPGADKEVIDNTGHVVLLHKNSSLVQELRKQAIQTKFSRAADSYDSYAKVQTEVARMLAAKLPSANKEPEIKTILEIGCGTGNFTSLLRARYPRARIIALDFSKDMLAKARLKLKNTATDFICSEGERYLAEAPDNSFDLVASNGSLQWFTDHDRSLKNIARILLPEGVFLSTIFGPDSLKKLDRGLKVLFDYPENVAAQSFPDINTLQRSLDDNFTNGSIKQELIEKQYESVHDLLVHIKKTGTGGWHQQGSPLLTPSRLKQLDHWFIETHGGCKVTYQVYFLLATK